MGSSLFIQLMNPAISLSLAGGFMILWLHQQQRPHLLALSVGYTLTATGFILQFVTLPIGFELTKCVSNLCFIMAGAILSAAILARYGRRVPYEALAILGFAGFAAFCWFMFVSPVLGWRILATNFTIGGMALLVAVELRPMRRFGPIERLLFGLALLSAANLLARPLIVMQIDGPMITYESLYQSLYWTTALLSHALISLLMALSLFTAAALDVVKVLKYDSETDPLSGLLNRRGFEQRAAELLTSNGANTLPVALVLADLDHFKSVNDRFGHDAGDRVIADFAALVRMASTAGSVAGRLGGEEFAILLPIADQGAARLFAEGIRVAFAETDSVTASFGVAIRYKGEELRPFLRRADQALYAAKTEGRNRVSVFVERREEFTLAAALAAV